MGPNLTAAEGLVTGTAVKMCSIARPGDRIRPQRQCGVWYYLLDVQLLII